MIILIYINFYKDEKKNSKFFFSLNFYGDKTTRVTVFIIGKLINHWIMISIILVLRKSLELLLYYLKKLRVVYRYSIGQLNL